MDDNQKKDMTVIPSIDIDLCKHVMVLEEFKVLIKYNMFCKTRNICVFLIYHNI